MFEDCKNCEDGVVFDYQNEAGETILRCTNFPQCRTMQLPVPAAGKEIVRAKVKQAARERVTF